MELFPGLHRPKLTHSDLKELIFFKGSSSAFSRSSIQNRQVIQMTVRTGGKRRTERVLTFKWLPKGGAILLKSRHHLLPWHQRSDSQCLLTFSKIPRAA